jgi:hypothetical protein
MALGNIVKNFNIKKPQYLIGQADCSHYSFRIIIRKVARHYHKSASGRQRMLELRFYGVLVQPFGK